MQDQLWDAPPGYFNTALRGIPSRTSVDAARRTIDLWSRGELDWTGWLDEIDGVRREFARLVGATLDQVGIGHTTASLVNVVAANLRPDSRVLVPENEHNSNTIPFISQRHRGVVVEATALQDLARSVRSDHAVVALSLVQSLDGTVADLAGISAACRRAGALLCVDATQAAGWLPFDARLADIVVCSSYKWLMGPNGPAFIVLRPDLVESFRQLQPNWFACEDRNAAPYGMDFRAAGKASKFDVVPGLISLSALLPALAWINQVGVPSIHRHNTRLSGALCDRLNIAFNGSSIVMLEVPDAAHKLGAHGIRATVRGDRVRIAIHVYNSDEDLDTLIAALR